MTSNFKPKDFLLQHVQFCFLGRGLHRPESMIALKDGSLIVVDATHGLIKLAPSGKMIKLLTNTIDVGTPNAICLDKKRQPLIANFSKGCISILNTQGEFVSYIDNIDGNNLGCVNFILRTSQNRLYFSVSSRTMDWKKALQHRHNNGYIALIENGKARIVADNLAFPNEIRVDNQGEYLYISETAGQRLLRTKIKHNGDLGDSEVFGPPHLGNAGFPDGITFDIDGNLWGTLATGEKIFLITPQEDYYTLLDHGNEHHRKKVQDAYEKGQLTEELMYSGLSKIAPLMSSITFGGVSRNYLFIGSVLGHQIPYCNVPTQGVKPPWWE